MRVVVADDSDIMRPMLRSMLGINMAHEVVGVAANGVAAIDLCKDLKPDFVVFDILMPVMSGDVAAKQLMADGVLTSKQIIMATSQGQEGILKSLRDLGVGIIIKPYRWEQLSRVIQEHVLNGVDSGCAQLP